MLFASTKSQRTKLLVALCAVLAMSVYLYGVRVLLQTLITAVIAVLFEYIGMCLLGKKSGERLTADPVITAIIFSLCLSPATPYWVSLYGMLFSIVIAKIPFGGSGKNIFNPAAAGLAFAAISFPNLLFQYPAAYTKVPLFDLGGVVMRASPGAVLQAGGSPSISLINGLLANYSGPVGATVAVVLVACGLFLSLQRVIAWRIPVTMICSFSLVAFLFPRGGSDGLHSVAYEMVSGIFLFACVFMASDPVTSPRAKWGQVLFGIWLGVSTIVVRHIATGEIAVVFPLLVGNALSPVLDRAGEWISARISRAKSAPQTAEDPEDGTETEVSEDGQ